MLVVWSSIGLWLWIGLVCGSKVFTLRWIRLGRVSRLVDWVGLKKLDPRTILVSAQNRTSPLEQSHRTMRSISWDTLAGC